MKYHNQAIIQEDQRYNNQIMSFSDVVETIKNLSLEEKQEIQALLTQYLREERREEIYNNYRKSISEEQQGELNFSSTIDELKQLIED
ncbi:MAG: hypothetical protein WBM32_24355 [Crocosphaera sp.]